MHRQLNLLWTYGSPWAYEATEQPPNKLNQFRELFIKLTEQFIDSPSLASGSVHCLATTQTSRIHSFFSSSLQFTNGHWKLFDFTIFHNLAVTNHCIHIFKFLIYFVFYMSCYNDFKLNVVDIVKCSTLHTVQIIQ